MHPAYSVIFFTVASGIGYGLLSVIGVFIAAGWLPMTPELGIVGLGFGFVTVVAGLLSSTFHLGHPERAWRALTQWRSSWLSREGVAAVVTFGPLALFAYGWIYLGGQSEMLVAAALLTALGAAVTVFCTGMIYRTLKTIHQWHNAWTLPNYLMMGLAGGAVWLAAIVAALGHDATAVAWLAVVSLALAWAGKVGYWRLIDTTNHPSTPESATGLGRFGRLSKFEGPHTSANYLMKEMGFQVARKHAAKLRRYAHVVGFGAPLVLVAAGAMTGGAAAALALVPAALAATLGLAIERWLFFAEANHVVTLYYGAKAA
jgi:DMSO reductase anchor subunit